MVLVLGFSLFNFDVCNWLVLVLWRFGLVGVWFCGVWLIWCFSFAVVFRLVWVLNVCGLWFYVLVEFGDLGICCLFWTFEIGGFDFGLVLAGLSGTCGIDFGFVWIWFCCGLIVSSVFGFTVWYDWCLVFRCYVVWAKRGREIWTICCFGFVISGQGWACYFVFCFFECFVLCFVIWIWKKRWVWYTTEFLEFVVSECTFLDWWVLDFLGFVGLVLIWWILAETVCLGLV